MNLESLKQVFSGDIETNQETLDHYSRDASMFRVMPQAVVFPKSVEDVKVLVKWVNTQGTTPSASQSLGHSPLAGGDTHISLTVRSAGTCMSGGAIGESIIVDVTRYLNKIKQVTPEYAIVEPGCYYRDFEKETLKQHVLFPSYTASRELCALGGMFGNNCAGEKTLRYGKFNDYILESKIIFSDGNEYVVTPLNRPQLEEKIRGDSFESQIYKNVWELIQNNGKEITDAKPIVSKNSAGYALWNVWNPKTQIFDLNQLLIGSQGTLGIVTEMKLRMVPHEPVSAMMVTFLPNLDHIGDLVNVCKTVEPSSIESFDDYSLTFAFKFFGDFLKQLGLFGGIRLGLQFIPEAFMMMRTGIPKLILMIEVTGTNEQELQKKLYALKKQVDQKFGYRSRVLGHNEAQKYWKIRRESFNLLRKHVKGLHTAPFIDDVVVPVERLPKFMPQIKKILDREGFIYTVAGHAGNGNFHIIPLLDFKDPTLPDRVLRLSEEVYTLVQEYHGSITAEHNDGIVRTPYLYYMFSDKMLEIFAQTKHIFDPQHILNPGKKVGYTKQYLKDHVAVER